MTPEGDHSSELAEARRRLAELESLVEISPVAIVVMDADQRVTGWNPAAAQLFGYSPQEAIGRLIDDLVLNEDLRGEGRDVTHEALERGRVDRITRRVRKDGELVDVQMMLVPLRVDGEHVGFYAIYHDITELQRAREHAETLLAVTQVLGKTLSLEDTFETILDELQRGRALRQLFHPGDSGKPPGDRERARPRRPGGMIGVGFDLDDETNPGSPGRAVEAATGLRRRLASPAFRERGARRRTHSRLDLRPDDRRRPRDRRHQHRQVRAGLLHDELADLATAFAAQAAMAIENARLLETERAAREQAETLRAAAESLGSTLGMSEVFDLILSELGKVVPYRSASIQQLDGDEFVILGGPRLPGPRRAAPTSLRLAGTRRSCLGARRAARDHHRLEPL